MFLQQLIDGIAWGSLYGALALSLVLTYRASGILNFAQGEMAMFSAFLAWQFVAWGAPLWIALVAAIAVSFVAGAAIERTIIRPLSTSANHLTLIIVTLGLMLMVHNGASWTWGFEARGFPVVSDGPALNIGSAVLSRQSVAIIAALVLVALALWFVFQRTKLGLAMRASSGDPQSAKLLGIPVDSVMTLSWGMAAAVGALMASLAAPQLYLQPNMLASTLIYSFAAAILGGLNSPVGAVVGGMVVGVSENLAGAYMPGVGNDFKQAVAMLIIVLVLLVKPEGLYGVKKVVRV